MFDCYQNILHCPMDIQLLDTMQFKDQIQYKYYENGHMSTV